LAAYWGAEPDAAEAELSYLRVCTDDALQSLARLIELLQSGLAVDLSKRFASRNTTMPTGPFALLGLHALDPAAGACPVRFLIDRGKSLLIRSDRERLTFEALREVDLPRAVAILHPLRETASEARRHLDRLTQLVLSGHGIDPTKAGPTADELRLFERRT